jgi:hypothetical protein
MITQSIIRITHGIPYIQNIHGILGLQGAIAMHGRSS